MTEGNESLKCTFEDAALNHLRDGIRMSVRHKIEFFEEMVELAAKFAPNGKVVDALAQPRPPNEA